MLTLVDDSVYEDEEEMRLVLGSATSDSPYGATIGTKNETLIKIKDSADSKRERKHCCILISFVYFKKENSLSGLAWVLQIFALTGKEHYFVIFHFY